MRRARSAERMQLGASMADRRHWWPAVARAAAAAGERPAALKARTSSRQRCAVASPVGSGARKCVEAKSTSRSARPAVAGANSAGTAQPCRPDMARKLALQSTSDAILRTSPSFFLVDAIRWRLARSCWGRRRTSTRSVRRWRDASARAVTSLNGSAPLVSGPRCSASVCRTRSLRTTSCSTFHGRVGGARQRWRLGVARAMSRLLSASAPPPPTATAPRPIVICARRRSSTSALHATSARRRRWAACVSPRCWIRGCGTARSVIAPLRSPRPSNRSSRSAVPHAHRAR